MKNLMLLMISSLTLNIFAGCPKDLKVIARELVELQLSGAFITSNEQCLKQEDFKTVLAVSQGSQEQPWKPEVKLDKKKLVIKLGEIKELNLGVYTVEVTLSESKKSYRDDFSFILLPSEKEPYECAGILDPFKRAYIYEGCE